MNRNKTWIRITATAIILTIVQISGATIAHEAPPWPQVILQTADATQSVDIVMIQQSTKSTIGRSAARQSLWRVWQPVAWQSVNWNAVNWNAVNWRVVNWKIVKWNSIYRHD